MIWDDHQGRCIGELTFRNQVRSHLAEPTDLQLHARQELARRLHSRQPSICTISAQNHQNSWLQLESALWWQLHASKRWLS